MPITITQSAEMPDGTARLVATTAPAGAEMRVTRLDAGAPRYLDPRQSAAAAWGAAEVWFRPEAGADGALLLGPEVTWHLKPHMPYAVAFRGPDGLVAEDRMVWKPLRLPSSAPPPRRAGGVDLNTETTPDEAPSVEEAPATATGAAVPSAMPPPELDPVEPRPATDERPARRGGLWALLAVLLLAGAGLYAAFVTPGFLNEAASPETTATQPLAEPAAADPEPKPVTLEWAREFLQTNPDAAAAAAEAQRFAAAGEESAAFLLLRQAARQGDAPSAMALGDMYAPGTWKAGVIGAADAAQALAYYEQAGALGHAAALERAVALVESGQAGVADPAAKLSELNEALSRAKESQ